MRYSFICKKIASFFTSKPISLGHSVSVGDEVISVLDIEFLDLKSPYGNFYQLKHVPGSFEFIGFVKTDGKPLYQLRHIFTGETLNLTKNMFEFFFEKSVK